MEVVENVALISINATLLAQLISFLVFMILFNRIMIRPLRKVMTERDDYMVQVGHQINEIRSSYKEIYQQIKTQEAEARQAAFDIRAEIEAAGQLSVNDLMEKTKREITDLRLAAQQETDAKIVKAREKVAAQADGLADQMIASLLNWRRLS
jgi:F-type H+-transporting ATPase subunit b